MGRFTVYPSIAFARFIRMHNAFGFDAILPPHSAAPVAAYIERFDTVVKGIDCPGDMRTR
jgi:hypothetical protein